MSLYTLTELETKILALDEEIAEGIKSTSTDGTSVTVDMQEKRMERDRLQAELSRRRGRRPTIARVDLGGF